MNSRFSTSRVGRGDARGVSEVLGAMLVFGLVLAVLALVQVSAVPAVNQQVEFEHSQRVTGDFQAFDAAVDAAATRGAIGSTSVEAGLRYPTRLFLINPSPVSGDLRTEAGGVVLDGLTGTAADEANDYDLGGTTGFEAQRLTYRAGYNEYAERPRVVYENGVLYERFGDPGDEQDLIVDAGSLVSGRRITIVTMEGDLSSQEPGEVSLNVVPVSAGTDPVTVTANDATITVRTELSVDTWRTEILGSEYDPSGTGPGRVSDIQCLGEDVSDPTDDPADDVPCDGYLRISLEDGVYDLRMAKVGLTTNDNDDPAADFGEEGARYLVAETTTQYSAVTGQTVEVVAEVRDRFNNPVSGEVVTFSVVSDDGSLDSDTTPESGVDGLASVLVDTTDADDPVVVNATIGGGGVAERTVSFTVDVVSPSGDNTGGTGGEATDTLSTINDRGLGVYVENVEIVETVGGQPNDPDTFRVTFNNSATNDRTLREARISFLLAEEQALYADVSEFGGSGADLGRLYVGDEFTPFGPIEVPSGESRTVDFVFYRLDTNDDPVESVLSTSNDKADAFMTLSTQVTEEVVGQPEDSDPFPQTFFVAGAPPVAPGAFTAASLSDLDAAGNDNPQSQTITFTLDRGLPAGETVTVDLSPAIGGGVDYSGATVDTGASTLYGGSVTPVGAGDTLTYESAGDAVPGGKTVTIVLDGVDATGASGPFTVEFTRSDVVTDSFEASFDVN